MNCLVKRIFQRASLLSLLILCVFSSASKNHVLALTDLPFIVLSSYRETIAIGDEFYLIAIPSTGKKPSFKSSDSSIASVNTYGLVRAKKDGTVIITATIKDAEASCKVTIEKTKLRLNETKISLESGSTFSLTAQTSNGAPVKYRSNKSSVASVAADGTITAKKPGEATITVTANTTTMTCEVNVKQPKLKINRTFATLYRKGTVALNCTVSSGKTPTWKSNRKSVATVDENGVVTAIKHGTAIITATVDGVSRSCEIFVKQPVVTLNDVDIIVTQGDTVTLTATVSSGNEPVWSSSNTSVVTVVDGKVTGMSKGTAYVYATEDGSKARCKVKVIEPTTNNES